MIDIFKGVELDDDLQKLMSRRIESVVDIQKFLDNGNEMDDVPSKRKPALELLHRTMEAPSQSYIEVSHKGGTQLINNAEYCKSVPEFIMHLGLNAFFNNRPKFIIYGKLNSKSALDLDVSLFDIGNMRHVPESELEAGERWKLLDLLKEQKHQHTVSIEDGTYAYMCANVETYPINIQCRELLIGLLKCYPEVGAALTYYTEAP